jgi:hypothetical protein
LKTEAVGVTQDAGGFVLSPVMSCPHAHASFYGWHQVWILFEQAEPDTEPPAFGCLALQHGFRHYCGSDDVHRPNEAAARSSVQ